MIRDKNYRFKVSISPEGYADKTISSAMIGSSKDKRNRRIRKQYGFNPNKGVGFNEVETTSQELLDALLEGKVFCHLFDPKAKRTDGTFSSSEKNNDNFRGSYVVCVDIDHTRYESAEAFIDMLRLKPTLWHTSYSNMQVDDEGNSKGARFRLVYVLDSLIEGAYYFRYCAWSLNRIIEQDTGENTDECNLRCAQYYNGTNKNNPDIHLAYGITDCIYSTDDIGVSEDGFVEFLIDYCGYRCISKQRTIDIEELLYNLTGTRYILDKTGMKFRIFCSTLTTTEDIDLVFDYTTTTTAPEYSCSTMTILNDWDRLDVDEFVRCREWENARRTIKYIYRKEQPEWINGLYQFVGDDYFRLYYYPVKVKDGDHRRNKLFLRMCLRRVINPAITKDEMVVNTILDIIRFFERDASLGSDFIKRKVDYCFEMDIEDIEKVCSSYITHLTETTKPKRGIIYINRQAHSQETTYLILDELYDPAISVSENHRTINNELYYQVSLSVLYRYLKDRGLKADHHKLTDEEIMDLLDVSMSVRKNHQLLKDNDIKIGINRVNELLNRKRSITPAI